MSDARITPEVADVLRRSTITGNVLVLPEQLDRPTYEAVNKVLVNSGGRWKRGKGHVFESDPRPRLGLALESGVAVDEKKKFQAFYTPQGLAARVVSLANVNGCVVLEPSAGEGALALECQRAGAEAIVCVEINGVATRKLAERGLLYAHADFLVLKPSDLGEFDRVVMNPPFSKNQDVRHVAHALKFLKSGGVLVAIMSPNTQRKAFDELLSAGRSEVFEVPEGAFAESGTSIRTIILKITKP